MSNTWFVFEQMDDHKLTVVKSGSKEYDKLWKQDNIRVIPESFTTRQAARNAIANNWLVTKEIHPKPIRQNFLQRCVTWIKSHLSPMED